MLRESRKQLKRPVIRSNTVLGIQEKLTNTHPRKTVLISLHNVLCRVLINISSFPRLNISVKYLPIRKKTVENTLNFVEKLCFRAMKGEMKYSTIQLANILSQLLKKYLNSHFGCLYSAYELILSFKENLNFHVFRPKKTILQNPIQHTACSFSFENTHILDLQTWWSVLK